MEELSHMIIWKKPICVYIFYDFNILKRQNYGNSEKIRQSTEDL
jgi:hypothetical protein